MIKKVILSHLLFSLVTFYGLAQKYQQIETKVKTYPNNIKNPEKLATLIKADFETDEDKAVAAYTWIGQHIVYDIKGLRRGDYSKSVRFSGKTQEEINQKYEEYKAQKVLTTLQNRAGVCENYALLYKRVCNLTGLECEVVTGYCKNELSDLGKMPPVPSHAWNKVKINGEWKFVDATWGAGNVNPRKRQFEDKFVYDYCLIDNSKFSLNHIDQSLPIKEVAAQRVEFSKTPFYWGGYIGSDMELLSPTTAYVATHGSQTYEIRIRNFPAGKALRFYLDSVDSGGVLTPRETTDSVSVFEMPCNFKISDTVHLFLDDSALATFKIGIR